MSTEDRSTHSLRHNNSDSSSNSLSSGDNRNRQELDLRPLHRLGHQRRLRPLPPQQVPLLHLLKLNLLRQRQLDIKSRCGNNTRNSSRSNRRILSRVANPGRWVCTRPRRTPILTRT